LTPRESETLRLLSRGLANNEIAEQSFVSVDTVKTHLKNIYRKLNVRSRRQAVSRARAIGLLAEA
jgi:LuxR family maltose regulon positive regulatory protein